MVHVRVLKRQTVWEGLSNRNWTQSISGGLSTAAIIDFLHLWHLMENVQLEDRPDRFIMRWTLDGKYSAKSAYIMLHAGSVRFKGHDLIWKIWAPLRIKIFLWLAFRRRHWTGDRRARHGLQARELCYLSDQGRETIDHILVACPFVRELWFYILHAFGRHLPQAMATTLHW